MVTNDLLLAKLSEKKRKARLQSKKHFQAHKETHLASCRDYYQKNKEKVRQLANVHEAKRRKATLVIKNMNPGELLKKVGYYIEGEKTND